MKITQALLTYVQGLIKNYEDRLLQDGRVDGPFVVEPLQHLNPDFSSAPNVEDYVRPKVIVWDPIHQHQSFKNGIACPHYDHAHVESLLSPRKWKDGRSDKGMPRQVYGVNGPVLLVSRVYRCTVGHEIVAHDPRLLENIPSGDLTFHLGHKVGFMSELCSLVFALASTGQTFNEIEIFLAQRYLDNFSERQCRHARHLVSFLEKNKGTSVEKENVANFPSFDVWRPTPSTDTIHLCFLYVFKENQNFFRQHMSKMTAEVWISADHTFKVAANVGCNLPDGSWSTQFDSLFIVLNENGQVLTYKLTKGTALDKVEDILTNLKCRFMQQKTSCHTIFVDNCCNVRGKLQQIFPNMEIKLDLFHAIQRITAKVPKSGKHYLSPAFINDFKMIFRADGDQGETRQMDTPDERTLSNNLEKLVERWKDVKYDSGELVLNTNVCREIENLKVHIEKGCLTRIPPGGGSTRNENLHKNLRGVVARSRLGCELAEALLSIFFYIWNNSRTSSKSDIPAGCVRPISSYRAELEKNGFIPTTERFGITSQLTEIENTSIPTACDPQNLQATLSNISMDCATCEEASTESFTETELKGILCQGVNISVLYSEIQALCKCPRFYARMIHLLPCCLLLFSNAKFDTDKVAEHSERLSKNLLGYQLKLESNIQDVSIEDSFFQCIISQLKELSSSQPLAEHLSALGILVHGKDDIVNTQSLRNVVVDELLNNSARYKHALITCGLKFEEEAIKFRQCGYFSNELGNVLGLAMSQTLRLNIVFFTSLDHMPVVPICPLLPCVTSKAILLGYSVAQPAHYQCVVSIQNSNQVASSLGNSTHSISGPVNSSYHCSCGRGGAKKDGRKFCQQTPNGNKSRCKCYIDMTGCTHLCKCVNCGNPYGSSEAAKQAYAQSKVPRYRPKQKLQETRESSTSSIEYVMRHGLIPSMGWSEVESFAFDCLVDMAVLKQLCIEPSKVHEYYSKLCNICSKLPVGVPLQSKTMKQIEGKLHYCKKTANEFQALYKKQVDLNWFA